MNDSSFLYKLMIVDDMEIIHRQIKRLSLWGGTSGFEIAAEAFNGMEAWDYLVSNHVDIVLTDIRMPFLDGIELLKKIKDNHLMSCVVLLSDFAEFSLAREAMVYGAFDYLEKPINEAKMMELLVRAKIKLDEDRIDKIRANDDFVKLFTSYILSNDERDSNEVKRLVDNICLPYIVDSQLEKAVYVISIAMERVRDELILEMPWLKLFPDIRHHNIGNTTCFNFDNLENDSMLYIEYLRKRIDKYILTNSKSTVINKICCYILENIDDELTLSDIASNLQMNRTYVSQLFSEKAGITLVEYLTRIKMERAKKLFDSKDMKAYLVAEQLGFSDVEYFSKLFKQYTGFSPSLYKKNYKI